MRLNVYHTSFLFSCFEVVEDGRVSIANEWGFDTYQGENKSHSKTF